ncbi:MAG TPA: serine hydrolase [Candidatus Acidoferrales bacterium]|nr:serine hydrolase [Candidatus Acidoferrales bacterium]
MTSVLVFRRIGIAVLLAAAGLAQDVSRMEQVVQSYVANKTFMGSVLVARGGEVLFSKGYGSANLEWNIPNSPATKFRLGSVTKQFTAASILLLEERGKLKTDDPVKKLMPDAPAAWDKITIFHLLTHTSGIPNFTGFPDYQSLEPFAATPEKLVARFRDKPLDFQPGEKWSYSNSGYVLLGYLLEKASGETYEKFVQANIFGPLGMKDSGYDSNSAVIPRRAAGYAPGPGKDGPVNAGFVHMSIPFSAGAPYSTTEDLLRWEQGLFGGKVLSPAALAKMTTPYKEDYACGVGVHTVSGHKSIDHGGGIEGFNTFLAYYPEDTLTVVALANLTGGAPQQIATTLAAVARGEKVELPSERSEITVAPKILEQYVGTYAMAPKINMMIRMQGGQLISQLSGQGKVPLFAKSETKFFPKVVDAEIEFGKDDKGAAYLVLHQGGRDTKAPRTSDTVVERKEIAVSPQTLAQYAGTYELRPGFDLVIMLEGDQLVSQATRQGKVPLFAESETKFFPKVMDAEIEFLKDDKGAVTHLVLHQGPAEIKAPRK